MRELPIVAYIEYWGPTYSRVSFHDRCESISSMEREFDSRMSCDIAAVQMGAAIQRMSGRDVVYKVLELGVNL